MSQSEESEGSESEDYKVSEDAESSESDYLSSLVEDESSMGESEEESS